MRHGLVAFVFVFAVSLAAPAGAQLARPAGVVAPHATVALAPISAPASLTWQLAPAPPERSAREFWKWTGFGALGGAALGAIIVAVSISGDEEGFIPPGVLVASGAVLGAVGGGVIGALAYTQSHGESRINQPPSR